MSQIVIISIILSLAAVAAFMCVLATVGSLQVATRFTNGILPYFFYFMFFSGGLVVASWSRQYSGGGLGPSPSGDIGAAGSAGDWAVRITSLLVMFASIDQLLRYFRTNPVIHGAQAFIVSAFLFFWVTTTVVPAWLSTHPYPIALSWFYTLFFIPALLTLSEDKVERVVAACRNAIAWLCGASLLAILVVPDMVLDYGYTQGLIPGLPRFAGLMSHSVVMGMCACVGIWCLLAHPMKKPWVNHLAWGWIMAIPRA